MSLIVCDGASFLKLFIRHQVDNCSSESGLYFDVLTSYFNVTVIHFLYNYKFFSKQGYLFIDYFTLVCHCQFL